MAVESKICISKGLPGLFVDGKPVAAMAYITYFTDRAHYRDFADVGYELFSVPVYFGGRGINPISHISAFSKGIYDVKGRPNYGILDREVGRILKDSPNAMIFPRVNLMMPKWWCDEHPAECNDKGIDGEPARECFASDKWREDAGTMLKKFIAHVEASAYRDHIVGYQIADGMTEEWFPFDSVGGVGRCSREGFQKRYGEKAGREKWLRYVSEVVAEAIAYFAGIVKKYTQRRLVVGCFYGYTLEVVNSDWGHHGAEKLLDHPDIDFFCSPSSYIGERAPGRDWPSMTALDSCVLHEKMVFTEYDTRTCLTKPLKEARPNGCRPGTYEGGVWKGPDTLQVSRWLLKNNAARQLTHGNGSWWFDMWGGWFHNEGMMADLALYRRYVAETMKDGQMEENQVAVIADEEAYSLIQNTDSTSGICCSMSREALGLAGVPYAQYQMGDFKAVQNRYRAFVFLAPVYTERMKKAIEICCENKIPYFVADGKEPLLPGQLREFYRQSKVHIWCETDDVIYAGNGWLSIHGATKGRKKICLPDTCIIEEREGAGTLVRNEKTKSNVLFLDMEQFETRLFRIVRVSQGKEQEREI